MTISKIRLFFFKIDIGFNFKLVKEWYYRLNVQRLIHSNKDFESSLELSVSKIF